jgi:hypothetical protein
MRAYPALTVGQAEVRAGQVLEDMTLGRIRTVQTHITFQCRIESADAAIAAILAVDPDAAVEERQEERRSPRLAAADGSLVS